MRYIVLITAFILALVSCQKEVQPPSPESGETPYVGVDFLYPQDSSYVNVGDTIRISIKYRADAGMHTIALMLKDQNHNTINIFPKHSHQGNIYIFDTLYIVEKTIPEMWFIGVVSDHLNNFGEDSICVFVK